jgi:hypothetical protein
MVSDIEAGFVGWEEREKREREVGVRREETGRKG